jgi:hypothetical protein
MSVKTRGKAEFVAKPTLTGGKLEDWISIWIVQCNIYVVGIRVSSADLLTRGSHGS